MSASSVESTTPSFCKAISIWLSAASAPASAA
jgi:hypothetical protein